MHKYIIILVIFFLPNIVFATKIIRDNGTGGDCMLIGIWDQNSKTCSLVIDLNESVSISGTDLTLDGNGHVITGNRTGNGISVGSNNTVRNITIENFSVGISPGSNNLIENSTITGNNNGAFLSNGDNNNTFRNNYFAKGFQGIFVFQSHGQIIENNTFDQISSYNINLQFSNEHLIRNNVFFHGFSTIQINTANRSQIYNNDFFSGNSNPFVIITGQDNIFDRGGEVGGNYWENYDTTDDGCLDENNDKFCDSRFSITGESNQTNSYDNFPFTKPINKQIEPPQPESRTNNPVIVVPGIMGSARKNGELVIDPILHTYDDLIATLDANGYTKNVDLFTFPYEWRDSNIITANLLKDKINSVTSACEISKASSEFAETIDCSQVDLVAHSMGGLVAREYIQSGQYSQNVDQIIFLGTPHNGAPTDYILWEGGKFPPDTNNILRGLFFEAEALRNGHLTIFDYIHNRPITSVQELLPTFDYLKDDDTEVLRNYFENYPRNVFLEALNINLDNLISSGVEILNITGDSGEDKTIQVIRVIPTDHPRLWEHGEPEGFGGVIGDSGLERGQGDNTVPVAGSELPGVAHEEVAASHNRIPTIAANRIVKVLTGNDSVTNIDNGSDLDPKILLLQLLSPVDMVITAPDGKKIGKDFETGGEYNDIPGAFYSGYNTHDEFVAILDPLDGEYKIELQGTDNGGEYTVLASVINQDISSTTEYTAVTGVGQVSNLAIDVDPEDPTDLDIESTDPVTASTLLYHIELSWQWGWVTNEDAYTKLVDWAESIVRMDNKSKTKFTDKKLAQLLYDQLPKLLDKGDINTSAYNLIKKDLEYLTNN